MTKPPLMPEFSRRIMAQEIEPDGIEVTIEADPKERAALAERFGLVALDRLQARMALLTTATKGLYRLDGHLEADVVQSCVVTLDPLPSRISDDFSRLYGLAEAALESLDLDPEAEDPPDPIDHGAIDIGEAAAEQLALCLDPFPRKAGVEFADSAFAPKPDKADNPFRVLEARPGKKV
jgi:uncharacterized metal-binding protein YceD (DUF177 family)